MFTSVPLSLCGPYVGSAATSAAGQGLAVDHERRHLGQEVSHQHSDIIGQTRFLERMLHQLHPAIARALIDDKWHVPHAQAGMAALLDVARRTAEATDQEITQPDFGARQVFRRVHRPKNVVARHLPVKCPHQARESFLADAFVDLFLSQIHNDSSMTDDAPKSALELAMERLRRKDEAAGVEERSLTEEQKAEIAEIKRVYSAKIAEAEILHNSKLMAVWDPEERATLEQGHRRDVERLRDDQERKLQKVRGA